MGQTLRGRVCEAGRPDSALAAPLLKAVAAGENRWLLGIAAGTCEVGDEAKAP